MEDRNIIGNRELTATTIPSPDADLSEAIHPFAMSYDGYSVWGNRDGCWEAGAPDWSRAERGDALPDSLTKLRTALFAGPRAARFGYVDDEGLEGPMRALVAAISQVVDRGPRAHRTVARAVAEATSALVDSPDKVDERALRVALGESLMRLLDEPVASSAGAHEVTFDSLPFWAEGDAPGPFDLVVGDPEAPRIAAEVKWASKNTASHTLWDILKLLSVLAKGAEQTYLIAGYPARVWQTTEFSTLFEDGLVDYTKLPLAKEWPSLIGESKGTPTRIPNTIEISEVARLPLTHRGEAWQLRAVAIDPAAGGWLELSEGQLEGATPLE